MLIYWYVDIPTHWTIFMKKKDMLFEAFVTNTKHIQHVRNIIKFYKNIWLIKKKQKHCKNYLRH